MDFTQSSPACLLLWKTSTQTMANTYRNNPNAVLPRSLDTSSPSSLNESMTAIVLEISGAPIGVEFVITPLTGGMTNQLFKVVPTDKSMWKEEYVVRIFGDGTDLYIDRGQENFVFASLAKLGLAPPFIGLFQNGRVEGYLQARPLELDEFSCPTILPHIARATAKLHATTLSLNNDVTLWSKLNDFFGLAKGGLLIDI